MRLSWQWRALRLACPFLLTTIFACKNKQMVNERLRSDLAQNYAGLIKRDSIRFSRTKANTIGNLSFETTSPFLCELEYWTSDPSVPPTASKPGVVPAKTDPASIFSITIEPLNPNVTYMLAVRLWLPTQHREEGRVLRIDEGAKTIDPGRTPDISKVIVAKVILPQQSIETYTHNLETSTSLSGLKSRLLPAPGCTDSVTEDVILDSSDTDNGIKILSTDGFARTNAIVHPNYKHIMISTFDSPQNSLNMTWSFEWNGKQHEFNSQPPGYMDSFRVVSSETFRIRGKDLTTQFEALSISATIPLGFQWVPRNAENSMLIVRLAGVKTGQQLECKFAGAAGSGKIPSSFFEKLPKDDYRFTAVLESFQFSERADAAYPPWIIKGHDWRFATLTKN